MNEESERGHTGTPASWILQVRGQLERPGPRRLPPSDVRQAAVLVPLYVDAGQLWTILTKRTDHLPSPQGPDRLPGVASWKTVRTCGTAPCGKRTKRSAWSRSRSFGSVSSTKLAHRQVSASCLVSGRYRIPSRPGSTKARSTKCFLCRCRICPILTWWKTGGVLIDGNARELRIYHVGRRQIWGLTARILQTLLLRLGVEDPLMGS